MNCKPGDLALVVWSCLPENIGKIVHVREAYRDQTRIVLAEEGAVWLCETAGSPLKWARAWVIGFHVDSIGPIPDACLRPLPELGEDDDVNTRVENLGLADNKMLA